MIFSSTTRIVLVAAAMIAAFAACRRAGSDDDGTAELAVDPLSLDLVAPAPGEPATGIVRLESTGSAPITLERAELTGDLRSTFRTDAIDGVKLSAGGEMEIRVTYFGRAYGEEDTAMLELESDAANDAMITVTVNGRTAPPPPICTAVFGAPAPLDIGALTVDGDNNLPDVATDGSGRFIAVWSSTSSRGGASTDLDILYSISTNGGETWTPPAVIDPGADFDLELDERPSIASDGGDTWIVAWHSTNALDVASGDLDILLARSTDDGESWPAPVAISLRAESDQLDELGPELATDGAGNWVLTWLSSTETIVSRRSEDNGETWLPSEPITLTAVADPGASPALATDSRGTWAAVWHSHHSIDGIGGNDGDIALARSTDNGAGWSNFTALNIDAFDDAKSDESPDIAVDELGRWMSGWHLFQDPRIYAGSSIDGGATWSMVLVSADTGNDSSDVRVASDNRGTWSLIWGSNVLSGDRDLLIATSTTGGATWSAPVLFNLNGNGDIDDDQNLALSFDLRGNGVAVWSANGDILRAVRTCD